jgi:hypothetical protein
MFCNLGFKFSIKFVAAVDAAKRDTVQPGVLRLFGERFGQPSNHDSLTSHGLGPRPNAVRRLRIFHVALG